jgi:hypothetical protein
MFFGARPTALNEIQPSNQKKGLTIWKIFIKSTRSVSIHKVHESYESNLQTMCLIATANGRLYQLLAVLHLRHAALDVRLNSSTDTVLHV